MHDNLLWLVFTSGLVSSTILPGNSEIVFSATLVEHPEQWLALLIAVTIGNTLGGMISWGMGRLIAIRYPLRTLEKPNQLRARRWVTRWGTPILLLSWVPLIGDPLCIAAGWLKTSVWLSLLFITLGKAARYALLVYWLI